LKGRRCFSGFRKILKKHDKNLNTDSGAKWRSEYVDTAQVTIRFGIINQ
jgi:SPX domain protein involved in polyphosphate accumulation